MFWFHSKKKIPQHDTFSLSITWCDYVQVVRFNFHHSSVFRMNFDWRWKMLWDMIKVQRRSQYAFDQATHVTFAQPCVLNGWTFASESADRTMWFFVLNKSHASNRNTSLSLFNYSKDMQIIVWFADHNNNNRNKKDHILKVYRLMMSKVRILHTGPCCWATHLVSVPKKKIIIIIISSLIIGNQSIHW